MRLFPVALIAASFVWPAFPAEAKGRWEPTTLPASAPDALRSAVAQADELYGQRHKDGFARKAYESAKASGELFPDSYDIQWRLARAAFWLSDAPGDKNAMREIAKVGWDAGERALQMKPEGVEALYFTGLCVGQYSSMVGVVTALRRGLEAKFRDPMLKAATVDERVDNGGLWVALGRYKFELPWPMRDVGQAVEWQRRTLSLFPHNIRAKVYLAEALHLRNDAGDREEAKRVLAEVLRTPFGSYHPFDRGEEVRARALADAAARNLGVDTALTP